MKLLYQLSYVSTILFICMSCAREAFLDDGDNKEVGAFAYIDGEWTLSYSAVPEHEYRLDIDVKGYDHISARQKMPKQVKVGDSFEGYKPQSSPLQNTYQGG